VKKKNMNIRIVGIAVIFCFLMAASGQAEGTDFSLKISCGMGFPKFGEVNGALDGWRELREREAAANSYWVFEGGTVKHLSRSLDFEGEILLKLSSRWALSVGAGTTYSSISEKQTTLAVTKSTVPYVYARPTKATATPLIFSAYHFLPVGNRFEIYGRAGAGWLWAKYTDRDATKKTAETKYTYPSYQSASGRDFLVHAGLGILYKHEQGLGFFGEVSFRRAMVDSMSGETKSGTRGDLMSFDEYDADLDLWQPKIEVMAEAPSGDAFRSVRKTAVDFGGFVIKLGVFIKF
jgi:hypothetical protein